MPEAPAQTIGPVVLVMQDDVAERALTVRHLRESGVDVVEATDGKEMARILDHRPVDVVLADLEAPSQATGQQSGQQSGLHLLRWLRERHPHTKAILASAAEGDVAALKGYGVFLSKPYRMVDLDHCLQRVLASASKSARPAAHTPVEPGLGRGQPSAVPGGRPVAFKADGRADEDGEWMARLSRQLGARTAQRQEVDAVAAKAARRAAMQAYDRARGRRLRLLLGFAIGAAVGSALIILVPMFDSPSTTASEPAPSAEVAALQPPAAVPPPVAAAPAPELLPETPPGPKTPPPEPMAASPTQAAAASPTLPPTDAANRESLSPTSLEPSAPGQPAAVPPAPNAAPLARDEVKEVQSRLRSLGFNPGPIDGDAGAMTAGAVMHYQQARGRPRTGVIDRDLLAQLREDPTPEPAPRAARADPPPRATPTVVPRRSDPFEPVRTAGDRFGRWLESLVR